MVEANAKKYLIEHKKVAAWICGDHNHQGCGLGGKLTDLGCNSCMYQVGWMGRNTISDEAVIYYNPDWPSIAFVEEDK
ncbi:MAG: hypothetical protein ACP5NZ_01150 [Nanobdellota archaeon]